MAKKLPEWLVVKIKSRGERIGKFEAPDAKAAIKKATKEFRMDAEEQKRLAAYRLA